MIKNIQETKQRRFQYLLKLFELANGEELFSIDAFELGDQLAYPRDETNRIFEYLEGEYLIERVAGAKIAITHFGIVEVERALSKPDEATTYFPPLMNFIHVEQMIGSQIQQGTNQSTQVFSYSSTDLEAIRRFVDALKHHMDKLELDTEDEAQAKSDVETIEAQVKSPRPKPTILAECLKSLRAILEGAAGSVIAAGLLQQLAALMK